MRIAALLAFVLAWGLSGCGSAIVTEQVTSSTGSSSPPPVLPNGAGVGFRGFAMAGGQAIVGANVHLYAAGAGGNGSQAASLLDDGVTTDVNGAFVVPSGYQCRSSDTQIYIVVRGGQIGSAATNSAIALMSVAGICGTAVSSQLVINEATTAASVWTLAQFLAPGGNVGASSSNGQGLDGAFAMIGRLVDLTLGTAPGATYPKTGTSTVAKINSLASLLNSCTSSFTRCGALFDAATPNGGSAPSDTLDAALNIVSNPGEHVAELFGLASQSSAFTPVLAKAPSDWTLSINYSGGGMHAPTGVGVDGLGDVWVASYLGPASEFTPAGDVIYPEGIGSGGLFESSGLAIDSNNAVWIPNTGGGSGGLGSITVIDSDGRIMSGDSGFTSGGLNYPVAVALDTNATAWVVDYGDSDLTLLSGTGQPLSGPKGYASPKLVFPVAVAIDANHNAWIANNGDETVTKVSPDGSQFSSYACCSGPAGIAIDQRGYVWVANYYGSSISELSADGQVMSSGYSDGQASINHPQGIAVDGAGHVWVANYRGLSLTELAGSDTSSPGQILSPSGGYAADAALNEAYAIAIDASGNLWVTNFGSDVLTEVIGLAGPVKTPVLGPPQTP